MSRPASLLLAFLAFVLVFLLPAGCAAYRAARAERADWDGRQTAAAALLNEQIEIEARGLRGARR
jgi:hypothetical protein